MRVRWKVWYGKWWLFQYVLDGSFSFGLHVDPITRQSDRGSYGPYFDLHLGVVVLSLGNHPARSLNDLIMRPEQW